MTALWSGLWGLGMTPASAARLVSLPESVAHAAGLGERGVCPNLTEVLNEHSFIVVFS